MVDTGRRSSATGEDVWPGLPYEAWKDTYETLHMWTQIVGKIRLALSPMVNHWWHVTLYVTPRGLTTSPIPYGDGTFRDSCSTSSTTILPCTPATAASGTWACTLARSPTSTTN